MVPNSKLYEDVILEIEGNIILSFGQLSVKKLYDCVEERS